MDPEVSIMADMYTATPLEMQNAHNNANVFVYSTTHLPLVATLSVTPMIHSLTISRTQATSEASFGSILTELSSTSTTPDSFIPSDASAGGTFSSKCFFSGGWALKEQCEKHCPAWGSYKTNCEVSKRSQWVCVACPAQT